MITVASLMLNELQDTVDPFLRPVSNERQRSPRIGWQCFPRGVNFNRYLNRHLLYNATSLLRCPFLVLNMLIFFHTERICRTRHEDFAIRWWLGVCQRYSAMFDLAFISNSSFCHPKTTSPILTYSFSTSWKLCEKMKG